MAKSHFFSPSPLEFHNFFRVFQNLDELSITGRDFKVMSHTGLTNWHRSQIVYRVENTRGTMPKKIPMKFSANYCRRHFIRVQLQSERLRPYYLKKVYFRVYILDVSSAVLHLGNLVSKLNGIFGSKLFWRIKQKNHVIMLKKFSIIMLTVEK